jgi:hypothetical protein
MHLDLYLFQLMCFLFMSFLKLKINLCLLKILESPNLFHLLFLLRSPIRQNFSFYFPYLSLLFIESNPLLPMFYILLLLIFIFFVIHFLHLYQLCSLWVSFCTNNCKSIHQEEYTVPFQVCLLLSILYVLIFKHFLFFYLKTSE